MFRLLTSIVLLTIAAAPSAPAAAVPLVRYESSGPGALAVTGNTLGLAGDQDGPGADDRIGVFTDADLVLQVDGWPPGTTDDWRLASSEAVLDLPAGATIVYAELVWGGSFEADLAGDIDGPVTLTLPSGASVEVDPDPSSAAELGAYYGRSADVTASIVAGGRYRVGAVPASLEAEDAAAGWALYVVYRTPEMLPRRVAILTFMQSVTTDAGAATASVAGLCPIDDPGPAAARLSLTAIDGDADIAGDVLAVARQEAQLEGPNSRVSVLGAADDNIFGGRIMNDAGALDARGTFGADNHGLATNVAGARQGWDVATALVGDRLGNNWQDLWLRDSADSDQHGLIAIGLDVDMRSPYLVASAEGAPANARNGVVRFVVALDNRGAIAAVDATLRLVGGLPAGVSYVAESFTIDGVPIADPVSDADFAAGVALGDLASGASEIAFELALTASSGTWSAVARVTYDNGACAGAATVPAVAPALSFTFEDPVAPEPFCGDGVIDPGETCDDGEVQGEDVDGCSATCRVDRGWACLGEPSNCRARCGDGLIAAGAETCDDGNRDAGDGCASDCSIELGYGCRNEPSVCAVECGDGLLREAEACDDGNDVADDGCSASCRFEAGWLCSQPDVDTATSCEVDGDEDGVIDADDNCPEFYNPDQSFPVPANLLCPVYDGPRTRGGGGCEGGSAGLAAGLVGLALLLRRRGVLALLLLVMPARAQEIDPRGFEPTLSPLGVLGVETSATVGHLRPWVNLVAALADDELSTQTGPKDLASGPVDYRFMMTFSAGLGLFDFLDVALGFPVTIAETSRFGEASSADMGMTDLRVLVRGRLLGPPVHRDGFGLALAAHLTFPTGSDTPYMSDGAMTVLPQLVMDYRTSSGFLLALNVGFRVRPERRVDDLVIGNELRLGLGAEVPVGFYGFAFTGEVDMAMNFADNVGDEGGFAEREVPVEVLGGMRWRSGNGLTVTGAVGSGITAGYGAPDFRILFGIAFNVPAPEAFAEPIVPASRNERRDDWKGGRLPAETTKGPAVSVEVFDRLAAMDPDSDGDGVPIPGDMCPAVPEDRDGFQDDDGCPDPDNDGDGVFDVGDKCPTELETLNGVDDYDGCPDDPKPVVGSGIKDNQIEIKDRIRFKQGSAELLPSDMLILDQVAAIMRANPTVKRFRIEGHTDNLGNREFNVDLAERRAWSVRSYLVTKGIEDTRLFAKGFGSTRPVAKNTSEAGRAQNRRVEFHIVRDGEPWEGTLP